MSTTRPELALPVPDYILDHEDPAAIFSRLQRVVIHLELLQAEAVKDFDISFRDFAVLATLRKEPAPHELPVTQLARYVLRPMGSISQGLDRLERAGLLERAPAPGDRRRVLVRLTDEGERFADEVKTAYNETRRQVFDRLSDEQTEAIDVAVTDLLAALDANWSARNDP